jgi:SRSO17 transposase
VARQCCGREGKFYNCQASVMLGYASSVGYGLVDYELYMPKEWFDKDHGELRRKCHVPKGLKFKTKNELLLEMLRKAVASEHFKVKYVGVDSAFGQDQDFLDTVAAEFVYFAEVSGKTPLYEELPEMLDQKNSSLRNTKLPHPSFPARMVDEIANDERYPWEEVALGIGSTGPIIAKDKCLKVIEQRNDKPGKDVWLYVRRLEDGSSKYALCNESMDASIDDIRKPAIMRWSIEKCFKECKDYLGMDHYEVRSWPSWRRHILLTLLSHLFVTKLRRKFVA